MFIGISKPLKISKIFLIFILIFFSFLFNGCQVFQKPQLNTAKNYKLTTSSALHVRLGPGINYNKITKVKGGEELQVIGKSINEDKRSSKSVWYGQMYRVKRKNGEIGFIASNGVKRAKTTYVVERESFKKYLYDSPVSDSDQKKLRALKTGEKLNIIKHQPARKREYRKDKGIASRDMSKVKTDDGQTGYVYSKYLRECAE